MKNAGRCYIFCPLFHRGVDAFVEENLIEDNTDTNDDTEFAFQDIIHNKLNEIFNIVED